MREAEETCNALNLHSEQHYSTLMVFFAVDLSIDYTLRYRHLFDGSKIILLTNKRTFFTKIAQTFLY